MIPSPLKNTKNPEPEDDYEEGGSGGGGGGGLGGAGAVDESDDESTEVSTNASDTEETGSSSGGEDNDDDDSTVAGDGDGGDGGDGDGDGGDGDDGGDGGEGDGGDGDGHGEPQNRKTKKKSTSTRKKNQEDDLTLLGVPHGIFGDDENEDSDDDDGDADRDSSEYFQKLASTVRESYIETYHPETMSHNYDEIQTLARVVRNADGVIVDDLHRTIPIMTKYEKTRILGQRAKQLNEGAPAFIKIDSTVIDGYLIAVKELEQKKTPFIIRRPLPNGGSEYWRVQDLEIL
jgi:DNA-directed RNA polymerase I, II, and III subunit RPABC2